jgi:hypothetical protein
MTTNYATSKPHTAQHIAILRSPTLGAFVLALTALAVVFLTVLSFVLRPAPEVHLERVGTAGDVTVSFQADQAAVLLPGNCIDVRWNVTNAQAVALNRSAVAPAGEQAVCLNAQPTLSVILSGDAVRDYSLNIVVLTQNRYFLLAVVIAASLLAAAAVVASPLRTRLMSLYARVTANVRQADAQISTTSLLQRTERGLRLVLLAMAALYLLLFLGVALARITYPFELEWMEGASADTVSRVLDGLPIYTAPSVEYVAPIYGPVYFYVSALAALIFGLGFFPLRLVSLLATLGCVGVIYSFVQRETRDRFAAVLGAGLFIATFDATGSWFDLARVDSLFLFLLLLGLYLVRFYPSPRGYITAGIVLSLSLLTKQSALVVIAFIGLYCVLSQPRSSVYLLVTMAVLVGGSTLLYDFATGGWYSYFLFEMAEEQSIVGGAFLGFWQRDLATLALAALLMIMVIYRQLASQAFLQARFFALVAVGMIISSWLGRLHSGGWVNGLLPAYAALALFFGIGVSMLLALVHDLPADRRSPVMVMLYLACLFQFVGLFYDPSARIPTEEDRQAGNALIEHLRSTDGNLLFIGHGHYAEMVGKPGYQFGWSMNVLGGSSGANALALIDTMNDAIAQQRFDVIVADNATFLHEDFEAALTTYYDVEVWHYEGTEFLPVTGMETRPTFIFTPKRFSD